jgi:selenocysteine lyase/cysteine desulfurase
MAARGDRGPGRLFGEDLLLSQGKLIEARALFPYTKSGRIYLNHAGTCPLSTRVVAAMQEHLRERSVGILETYPRDLETVKRLKRGLAALIHAEGPDRIALQANTSDALNIVASGLSWKTGDEILLNDLEFPANVYPYINLKRAGVTLKVIRSFDGMLTPEMIEREITPRTRLVALSAVQFLSGHRADLSAIGTLCRSHGLVFAVDGIQAVGAVTINVREMKIDALASGGQKWQGAPHGTGFLYVTEELQQRIRQSSLGWLAVQDPWNFSNFDQPLSVSARRYEGGSLNYPGIAGYDAAVSTLLEFTIENIEGQILDLTTVLREGLSELPGVGIMTPQNRQYRAGIVTISLPEGVDEKKLLPALDREGIFPAPREGKIRFSPHFYNTTEEMRRTVEAVRRNLRQS